MPIPDRTSAAVVFLDLQEQIVANSKTVRPEQVVRVAGVLARLATLHGLPAFCSSVGPGGAFAPEVLHALPGIAPRQRSQTSACEDPAFTEWLKTSGRSMFVLAGVASEIVVQRTALELLQAGHQVLVAVDACGGVGARTEDAAWRRIVAGGGATTSVVTLAAELAGDFSSDLGGQTLGLMYAAMGEG